MTTPDLSFIIPKKYKAVVALVGTGLSFVVPFVLEASDSLPSPWPAVLGAVLWLLTALGVLQAPYAPKGTTLAVDPAAQEVAPSVPSNAPVAQAPPYTPGGPYSDIWNR